MDVSITEAKNRLSRLIRAVQGGELVRITRRGKPLAELTPLARRRNVPLGAMKDRIHLLPGWDAPIGLTIQRKSLRKGDESVVRAEKRKGILRYYGSGIWKRGLKDLRKNRA